MILFRIGVAAIVLAACDYLTQSYAGAEACKKHSAFQGQESGTTP